MFGCFWAHYWWALVLWETPKTKYWCQLLWGGNNSARRDRKRAAEAKPDRIEVSLWQVRDASCGKRWTPKFLSEFLIRHVAEVYFRSISSISITHDRQVRDESCEKRFCKILCFSKDMFLIRHVAEVYFRYPPSNFPYRIKLPGIPKPLWFCSDWFIFYWPENDPFYNTWGSLICNAAIWSGGVDYVKSQFAPVEGVWSHLWRWDGWFYADLLVGVLILYKCHGSLLILIL